MTTRTIEHTRLVRKLGASATGHQYWLGADNYVYQQLSDGDFNGWICSNDAMDKMFVPPTEIDWLGSGLVQALFSGLICDEPPTPCQRCGTLTPWGVSYCDHCLKVLKGDTS